MANVAATHAFLVLPFKLPLTTSSSFSPAPLQVGGMGDVVTALGRAVQDEGHMVEVIIPKFDCIKYSNVQGLKQVRGRGGWEAREG